jgi:hypothetical protein
VAVEGEVTERDYLALLNAEFGEAGRFFIHPITERNGMKPLQVVERAIEQLRELERAPGGVQDVSDGRVQVWALFDHDELPASDGHLRPPTRRPSGSRSRIPPSICGSSYTSRT